jgi:hypothetical protein
MESDRDANLAKIVEKIRILLTGEDAPQPDGELAPPADVSADIRLQRLAVLAQQVFGDEVKAEAWLTAPQPSFKGQSILQLASHDGFARQIEEALRRIDEERIFSGPSEP